MMFAHFRLEEHVWLRMLRPLALSFVLLLFTHSAQAQEQAPSLTLGLIPHMAATDMAKRFKPLAEHLSKSAGMPVDLKFYKHFEGLMSDIGEGKVTMAFLGPVPYIQVSLRYGSLPILARTEIDGSAVFRGVIFVRKDSPLNTLADLEGAHIASVNRFSTMDLLIQATLIDVGISIADLPPEQALGSHQNVALGVLVGDFDAGCVKEDVFRRYQDRGLRQLAYTTPVPEHIFVANTHLPEQQEQNLREAFLALNTTEEGHMVMSQLHSKMTAMLPASNSDYDELRRLLSLLEGIGH